MNDFTACYPPDLGAQRLGGVGRGFNEARAEPCALRRLYRALTFALVDHSCGFGAASGFLGRASPGGLVGFLEGARVRRSMLGNAICLVGFVGKAVV